jgi:proline reductase-associated electron transfer protein PrdC
MIAKYLLKQHAGSPCIPLVKTGEKVERGGLIAEPNGLGANIHASITGAVMEVTDTFILIEGNGKHKSGFVPIKETTDKLEAMKEAGVVGAGGAGFPAYVKYGVKLGGGTIICNCAECEPLLRHNIILAEQEPETIVNGIRHAMEISGASKGMIAIKVKNIKAIKALSKELRQAPDIGIKILPDIYPSGDERVIVREILGHELSPGALPLAVDAIVSNVETIKNITYAIERRKPVIDKDLTVGGRVRGGQRVFLNVPCGTFVKEYINKAGGYAQPHGEIILGGPFTGQHGEEDSPVTKMLGGIIAAMPFPSFPRKFGVIACECGAQEPRLRQIVEGMGGTVAIVRECKRMLELDGRFRCEKPGVCPGQAGSVLELKRGGAEMILAGTCGD